MKANILLTLGLMFFCAESFAQDIIHTLDQRPIEAKVLEITDDYVRYKTFDNLDGPDYRMSVSRILRIVFANGTEKTFTGVASLAAPSLYGPIRYHHGRYRDYRGVPIDYSDYMGVALYGSDYRKAKSRSIWGATLTTLGATLGVAALIGSASASDFMRSTGMRISSDTNTAFAVMGAACLGVGIPLWISGGRKFNKIADDYNRNHVGGNVGYAPSLQLKSGANGVGLALCF